MDFLRGRLAATEGGFFKREQEDELKEYRRRRIREGAIKVTDVHLPEGVTAEEVMGSHSSEKLAEIYAQETRLSAPEEVLRRRVSSQMPPGEGAKFRARGSGFLNESSPTMPRTSLGRNRWAMPVHKEAPLLPEETAAMVAKREVAQKALAAGTRALFYGSAAACVGLVAAVHIASRALDINSEEDLRQRATEYLKPRIAGMKASMLPFADWLSSRFGGSSNSTRGGSSNSDNDGAIAFADSLRRTSAFRGLQQGANARTAE